MEDLFETCFGPVEEVLTSPSLELTCLGEAPLAAGACSHFFPHTSSGPLEGGPAGYRWSSSWSPPLEPAWHGPFSPAGQDHQVEPPPNSWGWTTLCHLLETTQHKGVGSFLRRGLMAARAIILRLRDCGSKSRGFMESWLVTQGVASSLRLTSRWAGTLPFEPLITSHIGLIPLDSLIHLLRSQLASIFGYQDISYLFLDSIQGNLILEGLKLFVCQFILPIFAQVAHGGTDPYWKVYGSLLRLLVEILNHISLLPEGEGPTIVFPQHLEESGQILDIPRVQTEDPVKHIRGISC